MTLILLIVIVLLAVGALPTWPYTRSYGYGYWPTGVLMLLLIVVVVFFLQSGRLAL